MSIQFAPVWNNSSVVQTCIRANATDTASAATSTLIDLSVNGVSQFSVDKTGDVILRESTPQTPPSGYITLYGNSGRLNVINSAGSTTSIIGSINTLTDAVQTFAIGTTGTDFAISSAAGVHTFNLPSASATARGVVTTGTQTFAGMKTFDGSVRVNGIFDFVNADNYFNFKMVMGHQGGASKLTFHSINANGTGWGTLNAVNGWSDGLSWWCKVGGGAWGFGTGVYGYTHGFGSPTANTTRLNGSTNPQVFTVANTYTSETVFELVSIGWASNVCTINTLAGSALGSVRPLVVGCGTTGSRATFNTGRFDIATAGSWSIGNAVSASVYSTFCIGDNSAANTQQTFSVGFYSSTYSTTQFARSTIARPWVVGSVQTSEFRAYASSASTSPFEFVWNNNTSNRWVIPNNRVLSCMLRIVGVDTTTANQSVVTFDRKFCIARLGSSGTVAIHGGVQVVGTDVDTVGGAAIAITADDTNKCANIQITSPNTNTWYWYGTLYAEDILRA